MLKRGEQCRLAQADHGNVDGAADLQEARLLEMTDDEGVIAGALRLERVADGLRRAAEFRQRMKEMVGRIEAVHLELDARGGDGVQLALQSLDVGSLLDGVDEALIPQPSGTRRLSHMRLLRSDRDWCR